MIVILEGFNGTGKTTAAKALVDQHGFRIYRPLRESYDDHWRDKKGRTQLALRACRVQANSYLDDVFGVDALAQLRPGNVVLDRSMPSALAYGEQKGEIKGDSHRDALEGYWLRRLSGIVREGTEVHYIWLVADHDKARARSDENHYPGNAEIAAMDRSFERSFEGARKAGLKAVKVSTNQKQAIDRIARIIAGETK